MRFLVHGIALGLSKRDMSYKTRRRAKSPLRGHKDGPTRRYEQALRGPMVYEIDVSDPFVQVAKHNFNLLPK